MTRFALATAFALMWSASGVQAAGIGPEKAAEMLAHAWMIDNRCNVLDDSDRNDLTDLVARAEISLAEIQSVSAARSAISRGRASGTATACSQESAKTVRDTLVVARSATAGAGTRKLPLQPAPKAVAVPEPKPVEPAANAGVAKTVVQPPAAQPAPLPVAKPVEEEPVLAAVVEDQGPSLLPPKKKPLAKKPVRAAGFVATPRKAVPVPRKIAAVPKKLPPSKALTRAPAASSAYAATAEAYYKELRCRTKSLGRVQAMYATVLRQHRAAVAASGKAAVRALLRAAEARASRSSC